MSAAECTDPECVVVLSWTVRFFDVLDHLSIGIFAPILTAKENMWRWTLCTMKTMENITTIINKSTWWLRPKAMDRRWKSCVGGRLAGVIPIVSKCVVLVYVAVVL